MTPTAGFCTHRLARLEAHLDSYVGRGLLPGFSSVIEHNGKIIFKKSSGYADIASSRRLDDQSLFRIYSLSKPITSVALMCLLEQGKLLLTDPVSDYLPELAKLMVYRSGTGDSLELEPCKQEIQVADLLIHSAGFGYGHEDHPVDALYRRANLFRYNETIGDMVSRLGTLPLKYQPGESWEYSVSHDVIGRLIEVIAGIDFNAFLTEQVFEPLGMCDTTFVVSEPNRNRLATLYTSDASNQLKEYREAEATLCMKSHRFFAGGEGLVSTTNDCHVFLKMLSNGGTHNSSQFLSRKTVALMTMNHLSDKQRKHVWIPGHGFGFGLGVLVDPAAHRNLGTEGEFGWAGSGSTYFWADPKEKLTSILFSQFMPSGKYNIAREFKTLMYQAMI